MENVDSTITRTFSGGEVHVKSSLFINDGMAKIIMTDYTMNGFMAACLENEILRRHGATDIRLIIPYFPYARQDRVMEGAENEPFSLKVFANMVNSQKFDMVIIADPHSDVTPALIDNAVIYPQHQIAYQMGGIPIKHFIDRSVVFVSPDAGAYKKTTKLMKDDTRIALGLKSRNAKGEITHTDVSCPTSLHGRHCIMVDDICDGGRTFIALAKALKAKGASKVSLYVTHGIFSQGLGPLMDGIDHVYTTNTFMSPYASSAEIGYITVTDILSNL